MLSVIPINAKLSGSERFFNLTWRFSELYDGIVNRFTVTTTRTLERHASRMVAGRGPGRLRISSAEALGVQRPSSGKHKEPQLCTHSPAPPSLPLSKLLSS